MKNKINFFIILILGLNMLGSRDINREIADNSLWLHFKQWRAQGEVNENQIIETLEELGWRHFSPKDIDELNHLLKMNIAEEELTQRLHHIETRNRRFRQHPAAQSINSVPISSANNLPVTVQDQREITQVLEDFQVNENEGRCYYHEKPSVAIDAESNFFIIWQDDRNGNKNIYGQLFDSTGLARGAEFKINDNANNSTQRYSAIGVNSNGNFVVVWQDDRDGNIDIYCQRFDKNGIPQGSNFKANDDSGSHYYPDVAVGSNGGFVVVWRDWRNSSPDIYGQRFNTTGVKLNYNFKVNDDTDDASQTCPAVSLDDDGAFVVVWSDRRHDNWDIFAQRYTSSGTSRGNNFLINDNPDSSDQYLPDIGVDPGGSFVVVWNDERNGDRDIFVQIYNADGISQGINCRVNDDTGTRRQYDPRIGTDGSGSFVVVWNDGRNGTYQVFGQQFSSSGASQGANFIINNGSGYCWNSAMDMNNSGNWVVAWEDTRQRFWDIYAQRFHLSSPQGNNFRVNTDEGSSYQYEPVIGVDGSGNFIIAWDDRRNGYSNIFCQRYNDAGIPQGNNFHVNEDTSSGTNGDPAICVANNGDFVIVWEYYYSYGQCYNSSGIPLSDNFKIDNNQGSGSQYSPAIDMDGNGNFVVVWREYRDGNYGIYGQRYLADGTPVGDNFKATDDTSYTRKYSPKIGVDQNGNFVVVWRDDRNGNYDIHGQRFDSNGVAQGNNFQVNDDLNSQYHYEPDISMNANGNFVVVWEDGSDIFGQRYDAAGTKLGSNFQIDENRGGTDNPVVSMDRYGNFVVVWVDTRNGWQNRDIYGQLFDHNGIVVGTNYRVHNDTELCYQGWPDVQLANGFIYYTWEDSRMPEQGYDIFARVDQFTMSNRPPAAPSLLSPADYNTLCDLTPSLVFTFSADPDSEALHFRVEVATDLNFNNHIPGSPFESQTDTTGFYPPPPISSAGNQCSFTFRNELTKGAYWWRVSAYDGTVFSEPSAAWQFTIGESLHVTINQIDPSGFPLIQSYVSVTHAGGAPLTDVLTDTNFTVFEDSVLEYPITVTPFGGGQHVNVPLAMDYSGSMGAPALSDMETAAHTFVDLMADSDKVAIFKFGTTVQKKQGLTSNKSLLHQAINDPFTGSTSTALYDAIWEALNEVVVAVGRKAVIALTDGKDNNSSHTTTAIITQANNQNTPVFTIGLGSNVNSNILRHIANSTGGQYYYAASSSDLEDIYRSISTMIANQYMISYTTHNPARDCRWRTVDIHVSYQELMGQDSSRYLAPCQPEGDSLIVENAAGGGYSTQNKIAVRLVNHTPVRGLQFRLQSQPNWLTFNHAQTTARTEGFILSATNHDSLVTYVLYHACGQPIATGNDTILHLFYDVSEQAQPDSQVNLMLKRVVVADTNALRLPVTTVDGIFSISGMKGDVNFDGERDILDIVLIVDFATGARTPSAEQQWAADCNYDASINILDIILLIQWINNFSLSKPIVAQMETAPATLIVEPVKKSHGNVSGIRIKLNSDIPVAGIQLHLGSEAEEAPWLSPKLASLPEGMQGTFRQQSNQLVILYYSQDGIALEAGEQQLLELPIKDNAVNFRGLKVEDIILANADGEKIPVVIQNAFADIPVTFLLCQNFPNPFNPSTRISYSLPEPSLVKLTIYNLQGQLVKELVNQNQPAGHYAIEWNGTNTMREAVVSGLYIYALETKNFKLMKKMVLVR